MKVKVILVGAIFILTTVGLSGCEEETSNAHAHPEGNFEIEMWFYSCFNETNLTGDSWIEYKITNLYEKPVTDVNISFLPRKPRESVGYLFFIVDQTDEILPNEDLSAVQSITLLDEDVYHEYLDFEMGISYNHPDFAQMKNEEYEGKLLRSVLWYEVGCEAPVYFLFEIECVNIYDS